MNIFANYKRAFLISISLLLLSGCATAVFQHYRAVGNVVVNRDGRAEMILADKILLQAYVECDPVLPAFHHIPNYQNNPKYCKASVNLFGKKTDSFEFVSNDVILRSGVDHETRYVKLNTKTIEGGPKQFGIFRFLKGDYDWWRGFSTGFLLEERPEYLELIAPDVRIEGKLYHIPVVKFKYWQEKKELN